MAEQKRKETKPTKPSEGEDAGAGSGELTKKGKKIKEDLGAVPLDRWARGNSMPIYEYRCGECGVEFEKLVGAQIAVACPSCASGRVIRRMSLVGIKSGSRAGSAPTAMPGGCCGGGCGCR